MLVAESDLVNTLLKAGHGFGTAGASAAAPSEPWALELGPERLWRALDRRRTIEQFAERDIPDEILADLPGLGAPGSRNSVSAERSDPARVRVAVLRSGGDRPGLSLADGPLPVPQVGGPELAETLQHEYMRAPIILFWFAPPGSVHEYYRSLIAAGAAGYDLWIAAVAHGLGAHPFGRPSEAVRAALADAGPGGALHLFTLALGWPDADDPQEPR